MVDLNDYIEGGDKSGTDFKEVLDEDNSGLHPPEERPTEEGEYPWGRVHDDGSILIRRGPVPKWYDANGDVCNIWVPAVGDLVQVNGICDVYGEEIFPQVVRIEGIADAPGRCGNHPFNAHFVSSFWCFGSTECEPYTGDRQDAPFILNDEDQDSFDESEDEDDGERPTFGDLVIVNSLEATEPGLPQVVRIDQDDHDDTPYRATFVSGESWWFREDDCEMYTVPTTGAPDVVPFSLNENNATPEQPDYELDTRVTVTQTCAPSCDCGDCDEYDGQNGELREIDAHDSDGHYHVLLDSDEDTHWVHLVEPEIVPASMSPYAPQDEIDKAHEAFQAAKRIYLNLVMKGMYLRSAPGSIPDMVAKECVKKHPSHPIKAIKDFRLIMQHRFGVPWALKDSKDLIDKEMQRDR